MLIGIFIVPIIIAVLHHGQTWIKCHAGQMQEIAALQNCAYVCALVACTSANFTKSINVNSCVLEDYLDRLWCSLWLVQMAAHI